MSIRASLSDPQGVLSNWDEYSVDACSWAMITCSSDYLVIGLLVLLSSLPLFPFLSYKHSSRTYLCAGERPVNLSLELCLQQFEI